jgi:hypothetical protein
LTIIRWSSTTDSDLESEGLETWIFRPEQQGNMTKNSLTLAVAFAALANLSAKAQNVVAYDNTTGYQGTVTSRGNTEIGDEINLTTGASTLTDFQFEYNYTGPVAGNPAATGVLRLYAKDGGGGTTPGTLLFESAPFTLQTGFNQGAVNNLSVAVPGTLIWTVDFDGIVGTGDSAGLLFYNGVGVGGGPGESFDDHWEFTGTTQIPAPHWALVDNGPTPDVGGAPPIDNFGARVTVVPEPSTIALAIGGAALLGFAARRRKA